MKKLILILIFARLILQSNAQTDNLQPAIGFFSGLKHQDSYYTMIKKVLFDSLSYYPEFRVVVMPSFSPEYLISLDTKNNKTFLTYRIAIKQIWDFSGFKNDQIGYNNFLIEFDKSIAKKIHELFFMAISQARFDNTPHGLDGTSYVFITFENRHGLISGMAWDPKTEKLSGLVSIVKWLNDCAIKGEIINKEKNIDKLNDLIAKFNKDQR